MLVFCCGFVAGVVIGAVALLVIGKQLVNMSWDEMTRVWRMVTEAGNNRVSTLTLCTIDGQDCIVFMPEE